MVAGPAQQGGGGHGAFAVAAHDGDRLLGYRVGVLDEVAEFDVDGVGQVPGGVFRAVPYVEDRCLDLVGADERGGGDRACGGPPRGDTAGQFAGDVGEVDVEHGPEDVGGVLIGVADDDDRDGGVEQP